MTALPDTRGAKGRPAVSVVMIFLDVAPYLDEAVASVLRQTLRDLELVLVDDGSTDGSSEIAGAWSRRDPRVVLVEHPGHANLGMSASRVAGVRESSGQWVAYLDGDDVWLPDHLERQFDLVARHPSAGVVVSPATIWVSWDDADRPDHIRALPYPTDVTLPTGALLDATTFDAAPLPTCGLMFKRDLAPMDGAESSLFPGLFEDQVMVARLAVQAPAVVSSTSTALYRQRPDSAVHRAPGRGKRDPVTLRYLEWIERYLRDEGELTPGREARLAAKRSEFDPRWRFWLWYGSRWTAERVLSMRVRRRLAEVRDAISGRHALRRQLALDQKDDSAAGWAPRSAADEDNRH